MATHYRGWMFIGFSRQYPKGKIVPRTYMNEEVLVFRGKSGELNMIEPFCSHFGVNMGTGKVIDDCIRCPMHGRMFKGDGTGRNAKHRSIRSYPVTEDRGLVFAYFDHEGVEPQWNAPQFLNDKEFPHILWSHSRMLSLHHPSVPLDNAVDPRHFEFTHSMFGKHTAEGKFEPKGHQATGFMSTELGPPLSYLTSKESTVTTYFDSPLNTYLMADMGNTVSHLCNLLTIIEGKKCLLTQIGIGRKSLSPLKLIENITGYAGSWYATYEDAPVWNDRKVQKPDNYPHETDKALEQFREWFETFAYDPEQPPAKKKKLKVVAQ